MIDNIKVFSALSEDLVSPLFPKKGENVKVSILFSEHPEWVAVKSMSDTGLNWHTPLYFDGIYI